MISHLFEIIGVVYDNPCDFLCRACPGRFNPRRLKRSPDPVQMHLFSNQMKSMIVPLDSPMSVFPLWLRSSKSGCSGLLIHWSYLGHSICTPCTPRTPFLLVPHLGDLSVILLLRRSMTVRLRRSCIILHITPQAYAWESPCRPRRSPTSRPWKQCRCATKASGAGIGGPAHLRGNYNQADKVGD